MALKTNALCKVADLQTDISGLTTALAERAINSASAMIERYLGRGTLQRTSVAEKVAAWGREKVLLNRCPIESITSVVYDGEIVDSTDYTFEAETGEVYRTLGFDWTAPYQPGLVAPAKLPGFEDKAILVVTYIGGWVLPNDTDPTGSPTPPFVRLPSDLEEAALELAAQFTLRRGRDLSITSDQAGNAAQAFSQRLVDEHAIPGAVRAVLDLYRRVA